MSEKASFSFGGAVGTLNINSDSGTQVTGANSAVQVGDNNTMNVANNGELKPLDALGKALCDEIPDQAEKVVEIIEELKVAETDDAKVNPALEKLREFCKLRGPAFAKAGSVALKAAIKGDSVGAIVGATLTLLDEFSK